MALDQGTTSSRALVFDSEGTVLGSSQQEFPQYFPHAGWVEHDPEDIWSTQLESAREALATAGLQASQLAAVGIANQRETVVMWDSNTGRTLGNAIVWQCRRTTERCETLRSAGFEPTIREKTGLRLDPYFSATKMQWLLEAHPEATSLLKQGRLRLGTIDSFLAWRLTGGRQYVTDYTNASRTMLFNLETLDWDPDLLQLFNMPREVLAEPVPSSGAIGQVDPQWLGASVPLTGLAGDQQASLFAQACYHTGEVKNTYGTGCFLLMNAGEQPVASRNELLSTVAWGLGPNRQRVTYALEGSVFSAGAAVQWLRDGLGILASSADIRALASAVPDNGGVYFVPALTGLGAPFWDPDARGMLIGITRGTTRAHIARAAEEAICCQTRAVVEAMAADCGVAPPLIRADGGATQDAFLMQLQADLLGIPVQRHRLVESTAFGAAALAGVAVGFWTLDEVAELGGGEEIYMPRMTCEERDTLYRQWRRAAERSLHWIDRKTTVDVGRRPLQS
jgi:glycerol kinase